MQTDLSEQHYDAVIIGAGLGGLLSAAQCVQRGMRVVVLERLPHAGGRFTAKTFQGAQVSTGAVHMLPFGSNGVLAGMLRRLAIPHYVYDADVFASFWVRGRQYVCRSLLGVASFLGARQFARLVMLGPTLMARRLPPDERDLPFTEWLKWYHVTSTSAPELYRFFERIAHFTLSLPLEEIRAAEVAETTKNMFRYGPPGIVEGGCAAVAGALEQRLRERGAELWLRHEVMQILSEEGRVTGVQVRNKATGEERLLLTPLVISNIGPRATARLVGETAGEDMGDLGANAAEAAGAETLQGAETPQGVAASAAIPAIREAVGLKVHLLSNRSLIPHKGIMYCLDTERIAGMVQPTNSDRRLAPPGKHLLITHQVIRSDDVERERALALADLRRIFGPDFEQECRVLTMSQYRGAWPVNRAQQGADAAPEMQTRGLYLVGDAVKPSGYLMVEGVAQSVNQLLDLLDAFEGERGTQEEDEQPFVPGIYRPAPQASASRANADTPPGNPQRAQARPTPTARAQPLRASHIPPKPRAARALYWLLAPPPPAKQEPFRASNTPAS